MDEKPSYPTDATDSRDTDPLLPVSEKDKVKPTDPLPAGAHARPPTTPQGAVAAIRRAEEEENRRTDFIQRLVPGYIPRISTSADLSTSPTTTSTNEDGAARSVSPTEPDQEEENRKTEFIHRLVPGYIPVINTQEATMGHLSTPPRSNGSVVMMTVLAGVTLLWFMLTATGGLEFGANCSGDMRQEVASGGDSGVMAAKRLVPLEAHVMSKCPDTKVRTIPSSHLPITLFV